MPPENILNAFLAFINLQTIFDPEVAFNSMIELCTDHPKTFLSAPLPLSCLVCLQDL